MSFRMTLINTALKLTVKPILSLLPFNKFTIAIPREVLKIVAQVAPTISSCEITDVLIGDMKAEFVEYTKQRNPAKTKVMLYLHGGGYLAGSPLTHRNITSRLSCYANCSTLVIDYRKAPNYPYPAALEDSMQAYNWLLDRGYKSENIVILGDSAGGNLTLITALKIRDLGLPKPAGIVCISPWTDLTTSGDSYKTRKHSEPMIPGHRVIDAAKLFANGIPLNDPRISPLYADYENMPPMLIHVGDKEILLSDSVNLHNKAKEHGVQSELKVWKNSPHVFQLFAGIAPQSTQSLKEIADFAKSVWVN